MRLPSKRLSSELNFSRILVKTRSTRLLFSMSNILARVALPDPKMGTCRREQLLRKNKGIVELGYVLVKAHYSEHIKLTAGFSKRIGTCCRASQRIRTRCCFPPLWNFRQPKRRFSSYASKDASWRSTLVDFWSNLESWTSDCKLRKTSNFDLNRLNHYQPHHKKQSGVKNKLKPINYWWLLTFLS